MRQWEGGDPECSHEREIPAHWNSKRGNGGTTYDFNRDKIWPKGVCGLCEAVGTPAGIGLEPTLGEWVENIVAVGREVHRVLRDDGTFWLNLGDAYDSGTSAKRKASLNVDVGGWQHAGQMGDKRVNAMLGAKNLMGQPWRVAFALQDDRANVPALRAVERIIDEFHDAFEGEEIPPKALAILERLAAEYAEAKGNSWILRSAIAWHKLNPMPETVRDRPTSAYEMIFLLTKQGKYFYDAEAVREPVTGGTHARRKDGSHALRHGHDPNDNRATWKDSYQPASANARNVWTFATQGRSDAHFACADAETEALTTTGWKQYSDISAGDTIATYNTTTQRCEWNEVEALAVYPVENQDMVRFKGRSIDQMLTPNHRVLMQTRAGVKDVKRADAILPSHSLPLAAPWAGSHKPFSPALAALIGWYVSEGHSKGYGAVEIYQSESANPGHCETIRNLLMEVGADYTEYQRTREWRGRESQETTWHIIGPVAQSILTLCPHKQLPHDVLEWDDTTLSALWDALINADGHRRENGRESFIQKGRGLIDQVQAVATRLGFSTTLTLRHADDNIWTLYRGERQWRQPRTASGSLVGSTTYTGIVWCPNTANGTWVARRNGRVFITGNTFPDELPRRCILAGTSQHGVCAGCGAPWARVVEKDLVVNPKKTPLVTAANTGNAMARTGFLPEGRNHIETLGWQPTCGCKAEVVPATVLDPFVGSGTTLAVAQALGRRSVGLDLNPEYLEIARRYINRADGITLSLGL